MGIGARRECAFRKTGPILAGYAPRSVVTAAAAKCPSSRGSPSLLALNSPGAMAARSAALVKDARGAYFFSFCATNFTAATPGCGQCRRARARSTLIASSRTPKGYRGRTPNWRQRAARGGSARQMPLRQPQPAAQCANIEPGQSHLLFDRVSAAVPAMRAQHIVNVLRRKAGGGRDWPDKASSSCDSAICAGAPCHFPSRCRPGWSRAASL